VQYFEKISRDFFEKKISAKCSLFKTIFADKILRKFFFSKFSQNLESFFFYDQDFATNILILI
jgi:hypothetical protein